MDHGDHGGLHVDLSLTGGEMKRRDVLRLATCGIGALYLFRCADPTGLEGAQVSGPEGEGAGVREDSRGDGGTIPG